MSTRIDMHGAPFHLVMLDQSEIHHPRHEVMIENFDVAELPPIDNTDLMTGFSFQRISVRMERLRFGGRKFFPPTQRDEAPMLASIGVAMHEDKPVVCLGLPREIDTLLRRVQAAEKRMHEACEASRLATQYAKNAEEKLRRAEELASALMTGNAKHRAKARRAYRKASKK